MKKIITASLFVLMLSLPVVGQAKNIYVSNSGSDYADGTEDNPYRTLNRANMEIESLNAVGMYPEEGVEVIIKDDEYYIENSVMLGENSGGTSVFPVRYKSENGTKIYSSKKVMSYSLENPPASILERLPETSRDKVCEISLSELGIADSEKVYMLYSGGEVLKNSRWPNEGYFKPAKIYDSGSANSLATGASKNFVIGYDDERFDSWTDIENIRIKGFARYKWSFSDSGISLIENGKITSNGSTPYGVMNGASFWFENVLEELDEPGEWYIDHENDMIYIYPKYEYNHALGIVYNDNEMFNITGSENIVFENLNFEGGRNSAINVSLCENVLIDNCSFEFFGTRGINISLSENSGVKNSVFANLGSGAVIIGGGVESDLVPGNNIVENCEIYSYDLINPTSQGVIVEGVGNVIKNNSVHDAFHGAVVIRGNNNILENNEIYNVLVGTNDAGAIYMYANSRYRGNVIRNNYIHHLGTGGESYSQTGIAAIYFDGFTSNQTVEKNLFYDINVGVHVNGGGYITVKNNVFIDAKAPLNVHRADNSTLTYWSRLYDTYWNRGIWYEAYPELKTHTSGNAYVGNVMDNNLAVACGESKVTGNVINTDYSEMDESIFADFEAMDFEIADEESVKIEISDFEFYDFSEMGRN